MKAFQIAVTRPIATFMLFIAVIVFGIYSYTRLPVDLFPSFDVPVLTVITAYPGAGAMEVERNITDPLESLLGTVPNLDEIRSTSIDDMSMVTMIFTWETDMTEAANDVRDRVGRARPLLPDDIDEPIIQKFDIGAIPVVVYSARATESYSELENLIDEHLAGPLNRLPGVGDVSITGAPSRQVQVILDPQRLEAYGLDIQTIAQALQAENLSAPAGRIDLARDSFNLRFNSEFQTIEEIGEVIVANFGGQRIRLHQVARVQEGYADVSAISRVNGAQGLTFMVQKQSDANTVEVSRRVRRALPGLLPALPDDVEVELIIDTSDFIQGSVSNLSQVLFYAVFFVVLVVLLFLRQWRATLIVAATIPVSLIISFIYLAITGSTLNIISLSSLSIALGMVVDDAIVVLENIMRHIEEGSRPVEAAIYGTREVGIAVFATTLTVVAVFLPLTFLTEGMTGIWFSQLGWIVVITVSASTFAALTLIPTMAAVLLKSKKEAKTPILLFRVLGDAMASILHRIERFYGVVLLLSLRFRKTVLLIAFLSLAGSLALIPTIGTEFMPPGDDGQIQISAELETSRGIEYTDQFALRLEERLANEIPEIRLANSTVGSTGEMFAGGGTTNEFQLRLVLVDMEERTRDVFEVADEIRSILATIPELVSFTATSGAGPAANAQPISIQIIGFNLETTTGLAQSLAEHIESVEGTRDVNISRGANRSAYEFRLDRDRLANFGLTTAQVSQIVRGNISGLTATRFRREGREYDVVLRFEESYRDSFEGIESMRIPTPTGAVVALSDLGELREYMAPPNIDRQDRERVVTVSAGIHQRPLNLVMADIQTWIDDLDIPPQIAIVVGGDFQEQQEAFFDLFLVLILSIILVYLVMAAQFESLKEPFVIMFSIPFAATGVILALLITSTPLSVIGFVGAIILVGIVVKNAIVLIDFIKILRARELDIVTAIVEGGTARLRPVLMTTLTTILAMMPLTLGIGEGSELWQPMAISVVGGLTFSTLVTLVIVPVIYGLFSRKELRKELAK